jgi:hypothetical protein
MSLEHSPRQQNGPATYTIRQFCETYQISKPTLYALWRASEGPRYFCVGVKRLITVKAASDWAAAGEKRAAKVAKAKAAE